MAALCIDGTDQVAVTAVADVNAIQEAGEVVACARRSARQSVTSLSPAPLGSDGASPGR